MSAHNYGQPLTVTVEDGRLVISIGVDVLAHAVSYSDWANRYDDARKDYFRTFAITDAIGFARDVVHAIQHEDEVGGSPISTFLDNVTEAAVDDGSEHVEYEQLIRTGETSPLEPWASDPDEPIL